MSIQSCQSFSIQSQQSKILIYNKYLFYFLLSLVINVILIQFHNFNYPNLQYMQLQQIQIPIQYKQYLSQTQNPTVLRAATLNYCGISNNPFQFYCQQFKQQLEQLTCIFLSILPTYFPNYKPKEFSWELGKIQVKFRGGRYSPTFDVNVGIEQNKFVNLQTFNSRWNAAFDAKFITKNVPYTQQQRQNTRIYDVIMFHCLLALVYGKEKKLEELLLENVEPYLTKYTQYFNLSFLNQNKKLNKLIASFETFNADIFFFQEFSPNFEKRIDESHPQYMKVVDTSKDTMILARKSSFKQFKTVESVLTEAQIQTLNWADKTALMCVDNYLLIAAHLSSKLQKSQQQINFMKKTLLYLRQAQPNLNIILGGDLNSFLEIDETFISFFSLFPTSQKQFTTYKKRTMTQGQYHKGNKTVKQSKDKIISNLQIMSGRVTYIDNQGVTNECMIPSDLHPFDHLVVIADILVLQHSAVVNPAKNKNESVQVNQLQKIQVKERQQS